VANQRTSDVSRRPAVEPSQVQISITVAPGRGARIRPRLARRGPLVGVRAVSGLLLAITALGAAAAGALEGARGSSRDRASPANHAEAAGVAAAYGYPLRCLTVTISASYPAYAAAHVDRGRGCARYHGYVNASFHRIDGSWRLLLDEGQLFVPNDLLRGG
jgi:hypothetical protein